MRHQIGVLSPVATTFLIPDNHIGRATVSSVAVAHEVQQMGGRSIACLNARDRNLLGFRRDLLTAAAYGVDQFLFVYGDEPLAGARTSELNVRTMLTEGRAYAADARTPWPAAAPMRFGATSGLRPLPAWKQAADFLCVQVGFSLDDLLAWRADGRGRRSRLRRGHRDRQRRHGPQLHHPGTHRAPGPRGPAWRRTATPASTPPAISSWASAIRAPSTACT